VKEFASEPLVRRLIDWRVDTVFGLHGDGPDGVVRGFQRHRDQIHLVLVHHEEAAAFMASAYAKTTGRVGVCLATSGPGAVHLLNGLYDAKLDHQPVLAITENQEVQLLGTSFQQEIRLEEVFGDVADYNVRVNVPVQIPAMVDIGIGHALARGTVSHITFPASLEPAAVEAAPWLLAPASAPTAPVFVPAPGTPPASELEQAAAVLNQGSRVALLVGVGALGARGELLAIAELLASPIVKSLPGKAAVPDDHPLSTGCVGVYGTKPAEEALEGADTLLVVGTNFPYRRHLPEPGKVRTVQIVTDLQRVSERNAAEVPLVGDAAETLQALLRLVHRKQDREFLRRSQAAVARWRERLAALEAPQDPIRPQYLMRVVDRLAADDAVLASDSGIAAVWSARHFDVRADRGYLVSANLNAMSAGLPYVIAAQWAHPGRQCIGFVSSEGFAKLMAEFLTAVEYDLPVKVIVGNTSAQRGQLQAEARGAQSRPPTSFAAWARACGALGVRVEHAAEVDDAVRQALAHGGPALVDVLVDPAELPRPAVLGG
jgi:pyruvate dehydrogenase (quinone)/pyruvate oxidase